MVLPVLNTFAGNPLDRAGDQRNSPDWLAEQAASSEALACVFWDGQPLLEDHADGPRLTWLALSHALLNLLNSGLYLLHHRLLVLLRS